ncbi:hypothetical protein QWY28_19490 [Nocardioides sp. SOB77]|uniref:DUF3829 domain-containing protein n=1 Tax=Nocardioides oceani TaxID=3058369 RepID=A0ABT8FL97_9ACTN|nr:hypothetical protein [Nocardioides oceani]MDN4175157.1 hypothetical protein [Nocardioides oceani]
MPAHRALAALAAAALCLSVTACGGDDDGGASPGEGGSETSGSAAAPTETDYTEAHDAVVELGEVASEVDEAGVQHTRAAQELFAKDPSTDAGDPAVTTSLEALVEQQEGRDRLVADLGELPAMADPEVRTAYEEYAAAQEEYSRFTDAFYRDFPVMLGIERACGDVFELEEAVGDDSGSERQFAVDWLRAHAAAAEDCRPVLEQLTRSENRMFASFTAGFLDVIDERDRVMTASRDGEITPQQAVTGLEEANADFQELNQEGKYDYDAEMDELSPRDERDALHAVLDERLGGHGAEE